MSGHTLGAFSFVRWNGPPPQFVRQHTREFTKLGQAGISTQNVGVFGEPFNVELTAVFANELLSRASEVNYRTLIGASPQILIYEGTNYAAAYQHRYFVKDVTPVENRAQVRLIGPGYDYPGGWRLISRWVFIPVVV